MVSAPRIALRFAGVTLVASALVSAASAVPLADYRTRLGQASDAVGSMYADEDEGPAAGPEALERARALLPAHETVELGDASIDVDNAWLGEQIDAYKAETNDDVKETTLEHIATRLYAMEVQLDRLGHAPAHASPEEVEKLREILSRPEYQPPAESAFAKKMRELRDAALKKLSELLDWLFGGTRGQSTASGMRAVIIVLGVVALVLIVRAIAIAVARRGIGKRGDRTKRKKAKRTVLGEELDESATATDIAGAARALAATGDYRGAVRKLFVALIYELDERGLVRLRAEATNREYLALVRSLGSLHPVMVTMTDVFERVWYGHQPIGRPEYDAFESMYTRAVAIVAEAAVAKTA